MKKNDKRKIPNRNAAIKTINILAVLALILWYVGVPIDVMVLGLLIFYFGIFNYYMHDYDVDIEDIKNKIEKMKKNLKKSKI